ncbi:Diguanylate Cyclase and Two-component system sensory domain-containing protein [Halopelagius inordinatus]|uniref:Diguanylate Cyclase and Two-component system sensory domain-containing protein n=1 Tax=Halopelagius inordinatus TaxID=553467 RepID=A0A1I2P2M0_9EURY|nr:DICT sensory domain-containing protein [Halopelagius inordinatus]SFG08157.1 Diguanylate Cyclase and Two-component system sensory domain-containing protein [Halopelagius inordinatus]
MTLASILEEAENRRKTVVYHAPEPGDFREQFDVRNVDVEFRKIPNGGPEPFLTILEDGQFRGAITLENLETFLWPPITHPYDVTELSPEYRALFELLDDTVFASLTRRQLLATSREFEDRAWRTGRGAFHVGFQSLSAFRAQAPLYRQMAAETDLDIHVYCDFDGATDEFSDCEVTLHPVSRDGVGRYWFLVFDGGGDDDRKNALVAEQRTEGTFYGVWTYDAALVDSALAELG